jgi:hypothetical protein
MAALIRRLRRRRHPHPWLLRRAVRNAEFGPLA